MVIFNSLKNDCGLIERRTIRSVVCLCDGDFELGFGHISRCLSLAEAFEDEGWNALFIGRFQDGAEDIVSDAGFDAITRLGQTGKEDVERTVSIAKSYGVDAWIIDSYELSPGYLRELLRVAPILLIDDYGVLDEYPCTVVLNPSIDSGNLVYPDGVRVLSGPGFIPYRRAFRNFRKRLKLTKKGEVKRILISVGGGDSLDITGGVVSCLTNIRIMPTVRAVVGKGYPWKDRLDAMIDSFATGSSVLMNLPSLAEEMGLADLCICAGGMTKYEAAYLGVPCVAIPVNHGQLEETRRFAERGLAFNLGLACDLDDVRLLKGIISVVLDRDRRISMAALALSFFPEDPTVAIVKEFTLRVLG